MNRDGTEGANCAETVPSTQGVAERAGLPSASNINERDGNLSEGNPANGGADLRECRTLFEGLAKRCEDSTGPDRDLDDAIMGALFRRESRNIGCQEEQDDGSWAPVKDDVWVDPETDQWIGTHARQFTSSIDEAMTLAKGLRGLSLMQRSNPDMGGRDWLASAGSLRSAARSWPLALSAVGLRELARRS